MKLRVWNIINPPNHPTFKEVSTPEDGARVLFDWANEQLQDPTIEANAFGLEVEEDGEWSEWENEDGYIDELRK